MRGSDINPDINNKWKTIYMAGVVAALLFIAVVSIFLTVTALQQPNPPTPLTDREYNSLCYALTQGDKLGPGYAEKVALEVAQEPPFNLTPEQAAYHIRVAESTRCPIGSM